MRAEERESLALAQRGTKMKERKAEIDAFFMEPLCSKEWQAYEQCNYGSLDLLRSCCADGPQNTVTPCGDLVLARNQSQE